MVEDGTEAGDDPTGHAAVDELRYGDAMDELEHILRELEADTIDVDELSTKVERAALLIRHCRERIDRTRIQVEHIVADLREVAEEDAEPTLDL